MKSVFIAIFLLSVLTAATWSQDSNSKPKTDEQIAQELSKVPVDHEFIVSGGFWEKGDNDGSFRIIGVLEGWEHLSNRVFLQWIRRSADDQTLVVQETRALAEINAEPWRMSTPQFVLKGKQWQIVIPAEHAHTQKKTTFVIKLAEDGSGYAVTTREK